MVAERTPYGTMSTVAALIACRTGATTRASASKSAPGLMQVTTMGRRIEAAAAPRRMARACHVPEAARLRRRTLRAEGSARVPRRTAPAAEDRPMERMRMTPRTDWRRQFEELGFGFHSLDDLYWDESVCYRFSAAEIDMLEAVTAELYELSLKATEHIIAKRQFERFAIPDWFADYMVNSWLAGQASLYGRFDLCYDGVHPPK